MKTYCFGVVHWPPRAGWLIAGVTLLIGVAGCGSSDADRERSDTSSSPTATTLQPTALRLTVTADDGHELVVWERHPAGKSRAEIVLLHGIRWSAQAAFDLQVLGQTVSLMENLADRGYTVYALDQRGYGGTERDATGWLTPDRAARDVQTLVGWVATHSPDNRPPVLFGWSMGALTAMLTAQRNPATISDLVLYGLPPYGPEVRATEQPEPPREPNTAETAAGDFITPEETPPGVQDAFVELALGLNPVKVDWRSLSQLDELDPSKVQTPTLFIHGERDPFAAAASALHPGFFEALGTSDRQHVVLAGLDHAAHLEHPTEFVDELQAFLENTE